MNKPRSDSKLDSLPKNQRDALEEWLFQDNVSLAKAQERLRLDFGLRCSTASLSGFYQRVSQRRLLERIKSNAQKTNEIRKAFEQDPSPMPRVVVDLVTQLAFEEISERGATGLDKDFLVKLTKLAVDSGLKAKKLELDERRIELLEARAAQAEAAKETLSDKKLSEKEQWAKLNEIFGIPT